VTPAPSSMTPIPAANHASYPVMGSVVVDEGSVLVVDAAAVATGLELLAEETAGALEPEGADDELVPLDELEELEELEFVELLELLELLELPELDELLFDPEPLEPPSGSVYCWSPADGPDASAAAGTRNAIVQIASRHAVMMRCTRIVRVLQAAGIGVADEGARVQSGRRRHPATRPANAPFAGSRARPGGHGKNATRRVKVLTAPVAPGDFDLDERRSRRGALSRL
jgi:hypothetical protein